MTALALLSPGAQTAIWALLFGCMAACVGLLVYKIANSAPARSLWGWCVLLAAASLLLAGVMPRQMPTGESMCVCRWPWAAPVLCGALLAALLAAGFAAEEHRARHTLSPDSIREATEDLEMGICFADPKGRLVLINTQMRSLCTALLGVCPQMLCEVAAAQTAPHSGKVMPDGCIAMPNGCVYRFCTRPLTAMGQTGWQQVTAQQVTEQYRLNCRLQAETEKLQQTNRELKKMYDRMAEDICETESLQLKMYVHDTIGRSILTVQDVMQSNAETEKKMQALRTAVGMLSAQPITQKGTLNEAVQAAAAMGVAVQITGEVLPECEALAAAAVRECATNCKRHAHGNAVCVQAWQQGAQCCVKITNNGAPPAGPITEGVGLSTLRRSVQAARGQMHITAQPQFCLQLTLPKKEKTT